MNTSSELQIGRAAYGKQNFGGGHGWFYIEDNKDNIFRVLPPLKSLAKEGKYAKYYRTHRGFRGTDGKQRPFLCIEEYNFKQKLVTRHCPICDIVAGLEADVKTWKDKGATDEQIRDFRNKNIFPFQAEGKYYLNVVNPQGKIGVLAVGSKMFKSLEFLALEQEKKGRDITGVEGIYLNFKKQTAFKGDKNATHKVDLYIYDDPATGKPTYVPHVIDDAFAAKLPSEAADLNNMFKELNLEQITNLCTLQGEERAKYIDTLFAAPVTQPAATQASAPAQTESAPAQAAAPTGFTPPAGFGAQPTPAMAPSQPEAQPAAPAAGFTPPAGFGAPASTPTAAPAAPSGFTPPAGFGGSPAPAAPAAAPSGFTPPAGFGTPASAPAQAAAGVTTGMPTALTNDKDFLNMVRPKKV